jgi:hypothetical protein
MSRIKITLVALGLFFALFVFAPGASYAQATKPASDVNVVNTPTVKLAPGESLTVGNTAANPVPVRDPDNPARQPLQQSLDSSNPNRTSFQVPLGKRLVIEYVSAVSSMPAGQKLLLVTLQTDVSVNQNPTGILHFFTPTLTGRDTTGRDIFVVSQQTRLYAEPGSTVVLGVTATAGAPVVVSVVGHLVDVE